MRPIMHLTTYVVGAMPVLSPKDQAFLLQGERNDG